MEFYAKIFGGSISITSVGQSPMSKMFGPEKQKHVINSRIDSG